VAPPMVMIFENLKKSWCICKCCVVVYPPTNYEKDWPTLLLDCFAWFSHRQALKCMCQRVCICECFVWLFLFIISKI